MYSFFDSPSPIIFIFIFFTFSIPIELIKFNIPFNLSFNLATIMKTGILLFFSKNKNEKIKI